MIALRTLSLVSLIAVTTSLIGISPASAAHTYLDSRNGSRYEVSPAMMHAIDMLVAARMKMMHHRH